MQWHRRNRIRTIIDGEGMYVTGEKEIRAAFLNHFRSIYAGQSCVQVSQMYPQDMLRDLPKIPAASHSLLEASPTELEIKRALMSLGPDKAPGLDGFNARLIQSNWDLFGPPIVKQVQQFFVEKVMPRQIARSNLVLVPYQSVKMQQNSPTLGLFQFVMSFIS